MAELQQIIALDRLGEKLYPLDQMLAHLPAITVDLESAQRVGLGSPVLTGGILNQSTESIDQGTKVRLYNPAGKLLAIAESCLDFTQPPLPEGHKVAFKPKKVLA